MVNRIDNVAYIQSLITRDVDMEMLQKVRQQQADSLGDRQLKARVKRILDEYHEVKKMMKAREDSVRAGKEINKNKRKKSKELDDAVALLAQQLIQHDAVPLTMKASVADIAKKEVSADRAKENATVDNMKLEMQADIAVTAKRESDQLKHESEAGLIVDSTLQKGSHREKDNTELQAVILNAATDKMPDTSAQKELLTGLPDRQSAMQPSSETEQKTLSVPDRQFHYPFRSWPGFSSVNMVMQKEATIAEASDDRVQQALQENKPGWQQDTPLIIMKQRDDQEKEQKPARSSHDENGDDE